ncbi:MAG: UDP-glucose 4-epimerase GalE [Desulfosudaceae bacterium]
MKKILLTGGAGYIGSHTCVCLLEQGYDLVVIDNLGNSSRAALDRVEKITGRSVTFRPTDIRDRAGLDALLAEFQPEAVIHFAGLKAVAESAAIPLAYYECNVGGAVTLFAAMAAAGVRNIVFSSSATVYGDPATVPITESFPVQPTNPYGRTKLIVEQILGDLYRADPGWRIILLRYFNPVGAHPSGLIGEDPRGIPNNLVPFIAQVAAGRQEKVHVFGNDYDTPDGTGVRDYIHIMDLARGHLHALAKLDGNPGLTVYNLGTGQGYSVLEMIRAFETACGRKIPYVFSDRRPGDIAACFADPARAAEELGWKAELDLAAMAADTWRWQAANPDGYPE